jgi:hypothetical protein
MALMRHRKPVSGDRRNSAWANQIFIFGHGEWDVCDGAHRLDVMNRWNVLTCSTCCQQSSSRRQSLIHRLHHRPGTPGDVGSPVVCSCDRGCPCR